MTTRGRTTTATLMVIALAAVAAGCGGSKDSSGGVDVKKGRSLFKAKCGTCHTLADAKTQGTFGTNLDEIRPDKARVQAQIQTGGGGMPAELYKGKNAETVAGYVAKVAGGGSGS